VALSAFDDKSRPPNQEEVAAVLGRAGAAWTQLRERIASRFAPLAESWGYASKSTGWGLKLVQGKRTVMYMTPQNGAFLASFALGERAAAAAREARLPAEMLESIDSAPRYAEGRGVRLEVRKLAQLPAIVRLAEIKMAN
jgi:hypothetical protein